jgi:hypothetical protein
MGWESKMQLPHGFHSKLNDSSPTSFSTSPSYNGNFMHMSCHG